MIRGKIWLGEVTEEARTEGAPALRPYLLEGDGVSGAVIVCPGGGYAGRAAHEGEPVAEWLRAQGIASFVLDYRVAPHRHPEPLHDLQRAIRLVRQRAREWRIRPERVAVLGFSAGGHLAASSGTLFNRVDVGSLEGDDLRPDALVLCYAVLSFGEFGHGGSQRNLLGEEPARHLLQALSLERSVTVETPPTFLWTTGDDAAVPVENTLLFGEALRRQGVPFALHVFPHGRHGLGLAQSDPMVHAWTWLCVEWLRSLGYAREDGGA